MLAGQEGFEPPTRGFGDRCSTSSSYWPVLDAAVLLRLAVDRVLAVETAELLELELFGRGLPVLRRRVIAPLTIGALQVDDLSDCRHGFSAVFCLAPDGAEPCSFWSPRRDLNS